MNDEPIVRPPTKDSLILELQQEIRALHASLQFQQEQNARLSLSNLQLIPLTDGVTVGMLLDVIATLPNLPQKTALQRLLAGLPVTDKKRLED